MLQFFRDGFYCDFIVLILITIIIGAIFSSGIAWAIDSHFGNTIKQMVGDNGEYDLILHVREEAKESALRELTRISEQQFEGAKISETITVAGQANFLFGFPPEARTKETFSGLSAIFNGVPGLNNYTVIVEPSVLVRGVHASVMQELQDRFDDIENVKFAFKDGVNILVVLDDLENYKTVTTQIEAILADYQVLELRFPMGFEVDTQNTAYQVIELLEQEISSAEFANVSSAEYGEELDAFLKTLVEMRSFLLSYASKVKLTANSDAHLVVGEQIVVQGTGDLEPVTDSEITDGQVIIEILDVQGSSAVGMIISGSIADAAGVISQPGYRRLSQDKIGAKVAQVELENERYRLNYTINESLRLLEELDELALEAALAVDNADAVLNTFQEALMQLEVLQVQIRQLNQGLMENRSQTASEQLIISLFLNGLLKNITQSEIENPTNNSLESLEDLDIESMRSSLSNIANQIGNVQQIDVQAIIEQISDIRDSLPQLDDEEIGKSVRLIDNYMGGQVIPGERVQILIKDAKINEKELEPLIRKQLENSYLNTYLVSVGTVNPDARTEVFRVLKEIRAAIAGILAIIFVIFALVLDQAAVFSTLKYVRTTKKTPKHWFSKMLNPILVISAVVGMIMLTAVFYFSKAELPFMNLSTIAFIGLILGGVIGLFSEKFSPVNAKEIMAGQALGLSNVQIMREIVIPSGRPGLLNLINRTKQRF
ncbi:MAG: sodium/proton-translocating pyrophosphatase [Firmicutes bacterium]|nr:sodium/proton-translocating pyrophosphatase [Bacillota bacterium]